jgi:translation initiation factor 2B subunit (eIF-2B alpha/beta/delta family)
MNNTTTTHKGDIVAVQMNSKEVWIHFQSPTGDSSDFGVFVMPCVSNEQAHDIAQRLGEKLGLDPLFYPSN